MAKIASFRGWRFNPQKVGNLDKVVTQPYDKIDDKLRADYMARSPYNLVYIIKDAPRPLDTPNDNQYTRAGVCWEQWIADGALTREGGPAIYPYHQEYTIDGVTHIRKGFIALVGLDDPKATVRAHEKTLDGPKADRLNLLRATEANDGLIFMLYKDKEQKINNIIEAEISGKAPVMEVTDDFGAIHRLYRISSPGVVREIGELTEGLELFIADGHHRYETAVNYMNECKEKRWKPVGVESFTHRMMALINMFDPGLTVLPTHRVLHHLDKYDTAKFLAKVAADFDIKEFAQRADLYAALDKAGLDGKSAFGFAGAGKAGYYLFTLKDLGLMDKLVKDHSEGWRHLDVTVLHIALLERLLGIDAAKLAAETNVHYVRGRDESLDLVGDGIYQAAFLLNSTRVDQVAQVASAGERMPQKSTDFYPKLLSGMVLMKMTIDKSKKS